MEISVAIISILIGLLTFYCIKTSRKMRNLPPGPFALPLIGNIPTVATYKKNMHLLFHELSLDYGDIYSLFIGPKLFIVLSSLQSIKSAVIDRADVFSDRNLNQKSTVKILNRLLGTNHADVYGVLTSSGEPWRQLRKMTLSVFRDFGVGKKALDKQIQVEAKFVVDEIGKLNGKDFDIKHLLTNAISNVTCSIVLGQRFDYDDKNFKSILLALDETFKQSSGAFASGPGSFISRIVAKLFKKKMGEFATESNLEKFYIFLKQISDEHRATYDENDIRDFIDYFIKYENENRNSDIFTEATMISNIFQLFGAGTETTNTTLRWLIIYLLKHPDVQEKCFAEIEKIIGTERQPEFKDRLDCIYVWATIHEVQRIANVVPIAVPHSCNKETTLNGYTIPENAMVFLNSYSSHMDPKIWNDPTNFRPERWIDGEHKFVKKEEFFPFSLGKRYCLGEQLAQMELFIFTTMLLQRYRFEIPGNYQLPEFQGILGITLTPEDFLVCAHLR